MGRPPRKRQSGFPGLQRAGSAESKSLRSDPPSPRDGSWNEALPPASGYGYAPSRFGLETGPLRGPECSLGFHEEIRALTPAVNHAYHKPAIPLSVTQRDTLPLFAKQVEEAGHSIPINIYSGN